MDCRYADSAEMKQVRKHIQNSSALLRSPEAVDLNAHAFQVYLLESFKDDLAVSLKVVQRKIRTDLDAARKVKDNRSLVTLIPSTLPRLIEICKQLNKKGLVLFLHNKASPEESFIVCDRTTLLSNVTGTVFAPKGFRQHCDLASSTGLVPLYKFTEQFKDYNIEMLIEFMSCLELCFEIKDKKVLDHISKFEQNPDPSGRYLFFPGLIRIEVPDQLWEQDSTMCYHFGWILRTTQDTEFFDPRSFQVTILRLVFTFGLAPAARIQRHVPSLQKFCSVWKNGICWSNEDGITTHLELFDNGKSLVVKMRSRELTPECLTLRSKVINKILQTVKDFCPNIETTESIINPEQVIEHPLMPAPNLTLSTVSDIAVAVVTNKKEVKAIRTTQPLQQLLQFEPYAGLDCDTLQCIQSELNSKKRETISDRFIHHFAKQAAIIPKQAQIYIQFLSYPPTCSVQNSTPQDKVVQSLKRWRRDTEGSYISLRETLNKLSIFSGRNPLDMAGVAHTKADPSLLFSDPPSTDVLDSNDIDSQGLTIRGLKSKTEISDKQLDTEIKEHDLHDLAALFDQVESYLYNLGLTEGQQTDIRDIAFRNRSTQIAMTEALKLWRQPNPLIATFRALLKVLLNMRRGDVALKVCQYIAKNIYSLKS